MIDDFLLVLGAFCIVVGVPMVIAGIFGLCRPDYPNDDFGGS